MTKTDYLLVSNDDGVNAWDLRRDVFACKIDAPKDSKLVALLDGHVYYLQ